MTYRVWVRDWVAVYTSDVDGLDGMAECAGHFRRKYLGSVLNTEYRIKGVPSWPATLELRLPTVAGEFRLATEAEEFRLKHEARHGLHAETAELGSTRDKELENYGKRKLPA